MSRSVIRRFFGWVSSLFSRNDNREQEQIYHRGRGRPPPKPKKPKKHHKRRRGYRKKNKDEDKKPRRYIKGWRRIRKETWIFYFGDSKVGTCYCCDTLIHYSKKTDGKGWHCSHVVAYSEGGSNEIDNLRCCCPTCNLRMGTQNLEEYKKNLKSKVPSKL